MKKTICVVGGGTAGWIAASYFKKSYQHLVDVIVVYDHKNPAIGVGESTTPAILDYLNVVGISYKELIKEIGATLKFGIKFSNWNGDDKYYYHNFTVPGVVNPQISDINLVAAYEISNHLDTGAETYSTYALDNNLVPITEKNDCSGNFALHIDALKFSEFIKSKFQNEITVIDDSISEVSVKDGKIDSITRSNGEKIFADMFIDASGLKSVLMNELNNHYVSKKDYLYMDAAYPCVIPNSKTTPAYTEAIATIDGWIWQIPMQGRFGAGYVYSTKFTDDETARTRFIDYIKTTHGIENPQVAEKPIKFHPGYWEEQWKGNCLAVGLASGFVEPLEATNIHMIVTQVRMFCGNWDLAQTEWSRDVYNKLTASMYEQTFDFIRLHYHTKRVDSELWKTIISNQPEWLKKYLDKCKKSIITSFDVFYNWDRFIGNNIFGLISWTRVSSGLGMFNSVAIKNWLDTHQSYNLSKQAFEYCENQKNNNQIVYVSHDTFLRLVRGQSD
jgi:tryptophan 7-halogenase